MCNASTDNQVLPEKNEKRQLFTAKTTITWDAVKTMNREVNGKDVARNCFVIMAVLLLISEVVLTTANSIVGYILMVLALLFPLLLWTRIRYGGRSAYEKSISKGLTRQFSFYDDHFEEHSEKSDHRIRYDEITRVIEGKNAFYLFISNAQAFIINKDDPERDVFLRQYVTKQESRASTGLFALLMMATALTTAFVLIDQTKPGGRALFGDGNGIDDAYVLRAWVNGLYYIAIILWLVILPYSGIIRIHRNNKRGRKPAVKIALNIVTITAVLLVMLGIGYMTLMYIFHDPSPARNDNGTYTVFVTSSSEPETEYFLYEGAGPFYLHYLRPMTDEADTDPDISEEQWMAAREAEKQALYDNSGESASSGSSAGDTFATGGNDLSSGNLNENASSAGTSGQEDLAAQQIETGYRMIYNAYFAAQGDNFEKEYDARANSYVVLQENSSSIRYLMYDRDSKNGSCGIYICFEAKKGSDGSWSSSETSILDMYAYEYSTGIMADSGKTAWADTGSEEYRTLTGE